MSKKDTLVFSGPVTTRSGYGAHARDLLRSLKEMGRFEIHVHSTRWGSTPMNALEDDNEFHQWIKDRMLTGNLNKQPEIWMQVTVPNEFQRVGKYNIGVTAGIETTACSPEWIQGMNNMDLAIVPSEFSKEVFDETYYKQQNQQGQEVGQLKVQTPIKVLFEGFDSSVYGKDLKVESRKLELFNNELDKIDEDFCFLFVGHWLRGDFGHDRKDVATLIKVFGESFKNVGEKPALVLKTSHATTSMMDRQQLQKKIDKIKDMVGANCPSIYLVHGNLTDEEMNELYNHDKMKAMVSFTKGEGFGRPLLEYSVTGKPVIASNFSGHVDFLDEKYAVLLDGKLGKVHPSAQWDKVIIDGSKWFYVDHAKAKDVLKDVFKNYRKYLKKSKTLGNINRKKFTLDRMTEEFENILNENLPKFPKEMDVKLPNLPMLKKKDDESST